MEATTLLTLPLLLFLSFATNGVSASRGISNIVDQPPTVFDSDGNELQSGVYYYLVPGIPLPRLYTAAIIPGIFSPGTVWLQLEIEVFTYGIKGLPVKFSPVEHTKDKSIHESTDLHIKFTDELSPVGGATSLWKVGEFAFGEKFLTLGGVEEDRSSWFRIEKVGQGNDYALVSSFDSKVGQNVGISERDYGAQRLALADGPLRFRFRPVRDETSASI